MSALPAIGTPAGIRLSLYRELFAYVEGTRRDLFRFWIVPFRDLPFRLGESLAEAKVPFAFDDVLDRQASRAVSDLIALLQRRFAPTTDEALGAKLTLREECMSPRFTTRDSPEQEVVLLASRTDPHLDCGLVDSWMARGGSGAQLLSGLTAVLARAIEEEVKNRCQVQYSYLATLAVANLLEDKKAFLKAIPLRGFSYERLEKAVGLCLFAIVAVALRSARARFERRNLGVDLRHTLLLMQTTLNPFAYISIKSRALQNDVNPWGLSPKAAILLEEFYDLVLQREPQPTYLEERICEAVTSNRPALEAAARGGLRYEARRRLGDLLSYFDDGRTDWLRMVASVVRRDSDLDALMYNHKSLGAIRRHLEMLGRGHRPDETGRKRIGAVTELIDALSRGDPVRRSCAGLPSPSRLADIGLTAFVAFILDRFGDGRLEEARGHLHHSRDGSTSPSDLSETWESGRLYRLSSDGRPFLMPMRRRVQSQMFIDLKGFTRRTHRAKEVVMADFMREQFYKPILQAAQRRFQGPTSTEKGEAPIELHNLLGDAAAFAGSTRDLVDLARDLRRIGCVYAERLEAAAPSLGDDAVSDELALGLEKQEEEARGKILALQRRIDAVQNEMNRKAAIPQSEKVLLLESLFEARFEELNQLQKKATDRLDDCDDTLRANIETQLKRLDVWKRQLHERHESTRAALAKMDPEDRDPALTELLCKPDERKLTELREELGRARGEASTRRKVLEDRRRDVRGFGLETGIYISHGASAEVISFEDKLFGPLRVAISEKINEAARGTARNPEIKAKMDAYLERERRERRRPGLSWPFLVYVDSAYSLVLPPTLSTKVDHAVRDQDLSMAEETARDLGRWTLRDLHRAMGRGDGKPPEMVHLLNDIHNLGLALSEEALEAFVEETLSSRFHFQHTVKISELHRDLQEPFVYLEDSLSFFISVPADAQDSLADVLVFRRAGNVQFRGFERAEATGVYEMLAPDTRFHRLLLQHHLADWIAETTEDPSRMLTKLKTAA